MLPDGWKRVRLGDIARISSGGTPDRSEPRYWNGDIPWVTTGEIQFNTITDTAEKITAEGLKNSSAKLFPAGTLLMAMYGQGKTRGQVAKLGIEAATNQACAAMRLSEDCDLDYIYQCLASHYEAIRELGNAGAQQNLSAALVKGITLPLPPQQEQVRIGALASCWDDAIASTGQLLANSRRQKQDLMQGLLTGHRTFGVDSAQWSHVEFDQVFERVTRKNTAGDQNVLTISGQHGLISQREYFSRVVASDDLSGYTHLSTGDFAYNKSSSNGYPMGAIKPLVAYDSGVVSSLYICFRIRRGVEADEDFFSHYFDAGMLNDEITGIAQEGARSHGLLNVSVKEFFKLKLRVPPLEDQRRIADVLNTAQEEIRNIEGQLERLKTEKRALMNELLTGKRRVRMAEETPT
ncbi:MAG TPA: restriction endonuclease subunit S [Hydrogenophaga sp.]|uniref:restriction endonuclease subunit S n=1 Tax=Hydrogenophaga sp. TaxID=1904254 RepID=UPI002B791601|nr:restriction endonuclease subunit S [Hydrogenophaga sp.]HSX91372.1 restriction endonuclease subunit S [Hydrogenophaga sp.]